MLECSLANILNSSSPCNFTAENCHGNSILNFDYLYFCTFDQRLLLALPFAVSRVLACA